MKRTSQEHFVLVDVVAVVVVSDCFSILDIPNKVYQNLKFNLIHKYRFSKNSKICEGCIVIVW